MNILEATRSDSSIPVLASTEQDRASAEAKATAGYRRVALICSLITAALGALAILGWTVKALFANVSPLIAEHALLLAGQIRKNADHTWDPMAASTGIVFLLAGVGLTLHILRPSYRWARVAAVIIAGSITFWGFLELVDSYANLQLDIEETLLHITKLDTMSPFTAGNCMIGGLAMLLLVGPQRPLLVGWKMALPAVVALTNLWVLVGFAAGGVNHFPIFQQLIPDGIAVAFPTAAGWIFFGVAVVAAAGFRSPLLGALIHGPRAGLLLRAFLPMTVVSMFAMGVVLIYLLGPLNRDMLSLQRAVLLATALPLLSAGLVGCMIVRIAGIIGDQIDQAESQRNRALEELVQARDAALAADRAKSQFLVTMNHELRTPLNAIIGYSELLQEEFRDQQQEALLPDLQKIHAAGKHLLGLINDILDLSKIEAGKIELNLETFALSDLIADVRSIIRPLVRKNGNTFEIKSADDLGSMHADQFRVKQCLLNLLSNAAKFTEKGTITFHIERQVRGERDWLVFRVRDTGIGIKPQQIRKLFQSFSQADSTTSRKYGGAGLGLAISLKLSQMMGGTIFVDSEPGQGSTFTLMIPAQVAPPQTVAPPPPRPAVVEQTPTYILPAPERKTILVVDDDPATREMLERYLSQEGYEVVPVGNGRDVVSLAREVRPQAITLDLLMPGMDGWSVLAALKADPELAAIPVIMLTIVEDRNLAHAFGVSDYLTKPIDRNLLLNVLQKYVRSPSSGKALVVEDDPVSRGLFRQLLERDGWSVEEAGNGREAMECVARQRPSLIMLDLMMPEVDGFEFLAELRRHPTRQSIPVLVVTARDLSQEDRMFLSGSMLLSGRVPRVFQKGTFSQEELLHEVRKMTVTIG